MSVARATQLSGFPEMRAHRAVGPAVTSVCAGDNSSLIAMVAPLYLSGRTVLDATWGRGNWWRSYEPEHLVAHDLYTLDGVDFRSLPHADSEFGAVCFDPPYVPHHSPETTTNPEFNDRFGLGERAAATPTLLWQLFRDGLAECERVLAPGGFLLAKCCDFVSSRNLQLGHVELINAASDSLRLHDLIVHATGTGPSLGQMTSQQRSVRAHSYLLVFRKHKKARP